MATVAGSMRFRAKSMALAADLDGRWVEMRIKTEAGQLVSIVCDKDAIFKIQRHIAAMAVDCPEMKTWR